MLNAVIILLAICYMTYGVVHIVRNKSMHIMAKIVWLAIVIIIPVGASGYLRTTFKERHGKW